MVGQEHSRGLERGIRKSLMVSAGCLVLLASWYVMRRLLTRMTPGMVTWSALGLACVFSGWLVWMARRAAPLTSIRAGLVLSSVVVSLVVAEVALTVAAPIREPQAVWVKEWYVRRGRGEAIYPLLDFSTASQFSEAPRFSGVPNVLTIGHPGGMSVADERGFNNPAGWYDRQDRFTMFVVGDSFVHGGQIVSVLREQFGGSIYNAAYSGNGPLTELATVVEYATPKRPALVLWFFYEGNDMRGDIRYELRQPVLAQYLSEPRPAGMASRDVDRDAAFRRRVDEELARRLRHGNTPSLVERLAAWGSQFPESTQFVKRYRRLSIGPVVDSTLRTIDPKGLSAFYETLRVAKRTVEGWGGTLVVIYLPEYRRFAYPQRYADEVRQELLRGIAQLDLALVDITPVFLATSQVTTRCFAADEIEAGDWKHYSDEGFRLVGTTVAEALHPALARMSSTRQIAR